MDYRNWEAATTTFAEEMGHEHSEEEKMILSVKTVAS